jgi:hypothetical protein
LGYAESTFVDIRRRADNVLGILKYAFAWAAPVLQLPGTMMEEITMDWTGKTWSYEEFHTTFEIVGYAESDVYVVRHKATGIIGKLRQVGLSVSPDRYYTDFEPSKILKSAPRFEYISVSLGHAPSAIEGMNALGQLGWMLIATGPATSPPAT